MSGDLAIDSTHRSRALLRGAGAGRGRRHGTKAMASGIAVGVALATYLLDALASLVGWLEPFQVISPFHWYAPVNPLTAGLSGGGLALLLGGFASLAAFAVVAFDRRDIGG